MIGPVRSPRRGLRGLAAAALVGLTALGAAAQDGSRADVARLLHEANGSDPAARLNATRALFLQGPAIAGELERAGAQPMATISPPRGDVVYSLLTGDLGGGTHAPTTFGLHIEGTVTADDVERMGQAHGFRLVPPADCQPGRLPTCYVQIVPGRRLAEVLRDVLTSEPRVKTVNLNYGLR